MRRHCPSSHRPHARRPFLQALALCAALLLPTARLAAEPAAPSVARASVDALTQRVTQLGGKLSLCILDVDSGRVLADTNPKLPINPASNMKLLTAAVALDTLGPTHVFTTSLNGAREGNRVAELVLRGDGDPSLRTADLLRLALALQNSGISEVGAILVDQSYFDAQFVPPAFEQQPDEWAPFRAPVSAVALEGNTIAVNVLPTTAGQPAHIWYDPEGVVQSSGEVATAPAGKGERVGWTVRTSRTGLESLLGGYIAADRNRMRFRKRLHDPRIVPGLALKTLLTSLGVKVGDRVLEGGSEIKERLVYHESAPLSALLPSLGKDSDNFAAEMLLKVVGAEVSKGPGTSAAGSQAILDWLKAHNALVPDTRVSNGSGLFDAARVSAFTFAQTLRNAYQDPRLRPEYVAHLAIGGFDGTLKRRFKNTGHRVRAKTGTLESTVSLSGYALGTDASHAVAFSILIDGISGHHTELRQAMDRIVSDLL